MSIVNIRLLPITLLLAGSAWLAAYLCFWLLPTVFETWNAQTVDQLFVLRDSSERLRPPYDDTVVHVDLNNSTIQGMQTFYLERAHFAQAARTLAAMGVAAQAYDFIFAAPLKNVEEDQAFIDATQEAGNVYFGLAMTLGNKGRTSRQQPSRAEDKRYVEQTAWSLAVQGDLSALYVGMDPVSTFYDLAIAARGLGYLSSTADRDGILRRLPLVVRYNGAFYPSLAFRVICRRFSQPETHSQWTESGILEDHWEITQPRNRGAPFIEGGFTQDRIVRPFVKAYHNAVGVYFELATSFHKLAVELFGLRFVEPMQLGGQPPIATIRQDGQRDIHVHIEPHLTGQAIEVKEIDTDAQAILHAIASGIADERSRALASKLLDTTRVGSATPQAVHGQLPYRPSVPTECHGLVHIADVLVAAFGDIQDGPAPGCGRGGHAGGGARRRPGAESSQTRYHAD